MKKINCLLKVAAIFAVLITTTLRSSAQVPMPVPIPTPTPPSIDLSMLTNHAALVGYAFNQIQGVQLNYGSGAQADNWQNVGFFPITNQVKTLDVLNNAVTPYWWGIRLVDTNAYVNLNAQFWNTNSYEAVTSSSDAYPLFYAYGGGQPVPWNNSYWTLPASATGMEIHLASEIRIKIPGLQGARLVVEDGWGQHGMVLGVRDGWLSFPTDYAGNGTIVLDTVFETNHMAWGFTTAYWLKDASPAPLTWVIFSVLLRDSEDFKSFKNQTQLDASVYSWKGYGKVPLLMARFDNDITKGVTLSVHSSDGQYATSYVIENQQSKVRTTITVPAGATSVKYDFTVGDYQIIPLGMNLKNPNYYGYPVDIGKG